jgi:hypothetical protein
VEKWFSICTCSCAHPLLTAKRVGNKQ